MGKRNNNENCGLGKLFYAVILAERECDFGSIGLDGQRVHSLHHGDVGALVSDYPRVHSIKLLRKNLGPYHQVTSEAAKHFATIPARFGQIARDPGEVSLALRRNYAIIRQGLARLDGKAEMGLKVWWAVEDLVEYFIDRDSALRARRDKLLSKGRPPNRIAQIEFGGLAYNRMQEARRSITRDVLAALPSGEVRLEDIHEDKMVSNARLLVKKDLQKELEDAVDSLGQSMGEEYSLKLDGPWPPFSFVDRLELQLPRL